MNNIKNTADLRKMLLDVIGDVRSGKIESNVGKTIGSLSAQVLASARLDFEVSEAKTGSEDRIINSVLLTYNDEIVRSPYSELSDEKYREIMTLKAANKSLMVICEKMKASPQEKKIFAAAFYDKPIND